MALISLHFQIKMQKIGLMLNWPHHMTAVGPSALNFIFCHVMLYRSAAYAIMQCLSVHPSVNVCVLCRDE